MMKIKVLLIIFLISALFFGNVLTQGAENIGEEASGDAGKILNATEELREFTEKDNVNFLSEQWKELLLKNSFVSAVDSFFRKISIVFVFIFGESYDLSFKFFMISLMWLFVFLLLFFSIKDILFLKKGTTILISLGCAVILGHIGIYYIFSDILLNLLLYREGIWFWISWLILIVIYVFAILYAKIVIKKIGAERKKKLEKEKQQSLGEKVAETSAYVKGMRSVSS